MDYTRKGVRVGLGPETLEVFQTSAFWDRAPGLGNNVASRLFGAHVNWKIALFC